MQADWRRKFELRSGSQCHRHSVGFLNVPVQAPPWDQHSKKPHHLLAFYDTLGKRRTYSRLKIPGPKGLTGSKISTSSTNFVFFSGQCVKQDGGPGLRLVLWNRLIEFNETLHEATCQRPLPILCFVGPIGKSWWRACIWLVLWNCLIAFNETWPKARSRRPLPRLCFRTYW